MCSLKLEQLHLRIGTRGSALARRQSEYVAARLKALGHSIELVVIQTEGDVRQGPISAAGGVGLFTRQLQHALLDGRIDVAVHSLKDLPTQPVPGLTMAAVPLREDPRDVLVCDTASTLAMLQPGARVGTGSVRRRAQLLSQRPDVVVCDIRGNVDTRLRKLEQGQFDAIILAAAGLNRLDLSGPRFHPLPPEIMLPAVGQGALGIEVRSDDRRAQGAVEALDDPASHQAVLAERAVLTSLQAGCLAAAAAWGRSDEGQLRLDAAVWSTDGKRCLRICTAGTLERAEQLGLDAGRELLKQGAQMLLDRESTE